MRILRIMDLPLAPNVCEMDLREVFRFPNVSMAHVTVPPSAASQCHYHKKMDEVYVVTRGAGKLFVGNIEYVAPRGAYCTIRKPLPHMLTNFSSNERLEHLVFASPPFDPADVHLTDPQLPVGTSSALVTDPAFVPSDDGAEVANIVSTKHRLGFGLARGRLNPYTVSRSHAYSGEEAYVVLRGSAELATPGRVEILRQGHVAIVPEKMPRRFTNPEAELFEVLCVTDPSWAPSRFDLCSNDALRRA